MLRYEPPKAGRQSELLPDGPELLGGERAPADAEVLAIAAECLEAAGRRGWVLALGHVGVFAGLRLAWAWTRPPSSRCASGSRARTRKACARAGRAGGPQAARGPPWPYGLAGEARCWTRPGLVAWARPTAGRPGELRRLLALGRRADAPVALDLGEVRGFDYYTGLVFRIYAPGLGFEVGGGGRYDALLAASGGRCPPSASCSASIAWRCCSSAAGPCRRPRPRRGVRGQELGARLRRARLQRRAAGGCAS